MFKLLSRPVKSPLRVPIKEEVQHRPIFRRVNDENPGISSDKIMNAKLLGKLMRELGMRAGFNKAIVPYDIRRGVGDAVFSKSAQTNGDILLANCTRIDAG